MGLMAAVPALTVMLQWQFGTVERLMIGGGVLCLVLLILTVRTTFGGPASAGRRGNLARLQAYVDREENLSPLERMLDRAEAEEATGRRKRDRSADLLPTLSKWINNSRLQFLNSLSADLNRIGSNWRASEIFYVGLFGAFFMFLVVGSLMNRVILGIGLAIVAFFIPILLVRMAARRWMVRFENQLADTLLLMSNATSAGYGFQQAMEMVAREGTPPMNEEFAKVNQEVQLGVPIADALNHMGERVQNADLTLSITAIQISMEVGAALSEILRIISETIRERVRIRGEISILTTQGKVTGLGLTLLPIFMFFLLSAMIPPDEATGERYTAPLFNGEVYPAGPKIVGVGIVMQIIGYYFIQKIVNIDI